MAPNYGQQPPVQNLYHQPGQGSPGDVYGRYGIDRAGTSDNAGQVQDQSERYVDHDIADGGLFERLIGQLTREGRVNERFNEEMSAQAQALAQGVRTRQAPPIAAGNYPGVDHQEMRAMVNDGVDPGQVGEMSGAWLEIGNGVADFQQDFATAIANSESEWRGTAGDSARQFMADTANYIGQAGQSAQLAGSQQAIHAEALTTAKNSMPEPVPFDSAAANRDLQATTNPLDYMTKYADHMAAYQASQAAQRQAAQVMTTYDNGLGGATTMPAFSAPPQMGGGAGDQGGPGGTATGTGTGGGGSFGGSGIGGGSGGTLPGGGGGGVGGRGRGVSTGSGPPGGGGTTTGAGARPPATLPGRIPGGGNPGADGPGGLPIGPMGPVGPGAGGDTTRGPGPGPGRGGGPGGGRFGPGGGPGTGGGRAGFGPGGSGAGAGVGAGARAFGPGGSGAGVGALAAEQAAGGRGAAGAAGRAGAAGGGGMGGMGAGRGQGGEDSEHQRPTYLIEPDPDEVFGTDQRTAPPVIG